MARPVHRPPSGRKGSGFEAQTRATIDQVSKEVPKSLEELEKLPIYLVLFVVGGFGAMGLGILVFLINIVSVPRAFVIHVVQLIISVVFGFLLLWTYTQVRRAPKTAYVLGFVFGIILLFGNIGSVIGGILGIIGALILFLKTEQLL
jgi:hypothetical protein